MPTLRSMECLVAVADTGSITEAARQMFLSQPAVSHQLSLLERECGVRLLHRESRGVRLSAAGRAMLGQARRAVEAAEAAVAAARAVGAASAGLLRIACAQSLLSTLAPVLRAWHRDRPDVVLTVRESADARELLDLLDSDAADVVLMPAPVPDRYTARRVAEEPVVVVTAPDHRFADLPAVTLEDLEGEPLVHFSAENGLSTWLDRALADAGIAMRPVTSSSITSGAALLAAAGLGVAVCPVSAVAGGILGSVRPFSPPWPRELLALTVPDPDALVLRFVEDVTDSGVWMSADISAQLAGRRPSG